ncbi:hypothetical protein K2173_011187 [Erythroxylum novogranatense]|uniref:Expansin-like EG45 domain-containing protein n=1 Tax=Erythroxylum novogranatense TaxID=1862640 RepID=A0AAV8TV53_9ROSI|nr:hypothetical protein K2173_011187 [Erythroxylum novogranatense]
MSQRSQNVIALLICMSFNFWSLALAQGTYGVASFYTPPYVPSKCNGFADDGVWIAAANADLFDGGAACGRYYWVICTGGTNLGTLHPCTNKWVKVKIVELCPSCKQRHIALDLSNQAFAYIADPASGLIQVYYQPI